MNYLLWLLTFVWIPTVALWYFNFNLLKRYWKTFLYAMFFTLLFSIPWDILAVRNQTWYFPVGHNIGLYILELPFEEYLFMTTVTAFVATMTIIFKYQRNK